jgi:hypothetical protein
MSVDLDSLRQGWDRQALCRGPSPAPKGPRCYNVTSLSWGRMAEGVRMAEEQFYRNPTIILIIFRILVPPQLDVNTK